MIKSIKVYLAGTATMMCVKSINDIKVLNYLLSIMETTNQVRFTRFRREETSNYTGIPIGSISRHLANLKSLNIIRVGVQILLLTH